jgi:hypothetical protein
VRPQDAGPFRKTIDRETGDGALLGIEGLGIRNVVMIG